MYVEQNIDLNGASTERSLNPTQYLKLSSIVQKKLQASAQQVYYAFFLELQGLKQQFRNPILACFLAYLELLIPVA